MKNIFTNFIEKTGSFLAFMPLLLIFTQFVIILMASIFDQGSIKLQESLYYINALMFLGGAGYTLKHNDHVRVDLFYHRLSHRHKDMIDLLGIIFLMLPFTALIWITGLPYVLESWSEMEASVESSGLPFVYLLKTTILLFALTISLQAFVNITEIIQRFRNYHKGHKK